jgi:hypothetical protein
MIPRAYWREHHAPSAGDDQVEQDLVRSLAVQFDSQSRSGSNREQLSPLHEAHRRKRFASGV